MSGSRNTRRLAVAVAMSAALWLASVSAGVGQAMCEDPSQSCGAMLHPTCLQKVGAGALSADGSASASQDAPTVDCDVQLDLYRNCLESVVKKCDTRPKNLETTRQALSILTEAARRQCALRFRSDGAGICRRGSEHRRL